MGYVITIATQFRKTLSEKRPFSTKPAQLFYVHVAQMAQNANTICLQTIREHSGKVCTIKYVTKYKLLFVTISHAAKGHACPVANLGMATHVFQHSFKYHLQWVIFINLRFKSNTQCTGTINVYTATVHMCAYRVKD